MTITLSKNEIQFDEGLYKPLKDVYTLSILDLDKYKNSYFKRCKVNGQDWNILDKEDYSYINIDNKIKNVPLVKITKKKNGDVVIKCKNIISLFGDFYVV